MTGMPDNSHSSALHFTHPSTIDFTPRNLFVSFNKGLEQIFYAINKKKVSQNDGGSLCIALYYVGLERAIRCILSHFQQLL